MLRLVVSLGIAVTENGSQPTDLVKSGTRGTPKSQPSMVAIRKAIFMAAYSEGLI